MGSEMQAGGGMHQPETAWGLLVGQRQHGAHARSEPPSAAQQDEAKPTHKRPPCLHAIPAHVGVADHARVAVVPVVQAAHVWLHHADAALRCGRALHKAAGGRWGGGAGRVGGEACERSMAVGTGSGLAGAFPATPAVPKTQSAAVHSPCTPVHQHQVASDALSLQLLAGLRKQPMRGRTT